MVNDCTFIGRLTKDPETFGSDKKVAKFTLAVDTGYGDYGYTFFANCVVFGKLVGVCEDYLAKGKLVYVKTECKTDKWEDKEGNTKYSTSFNVRTMKMLGGKDEKPKTEIPDGPHEKDVPF